MFYSFLSAAFISPLSQFLSFFFSSHYFLSSLPISFFSFLSLFLPLFSHPISISLSLCSASLSYVLSLCSHKLTYEFLWDQDLRETCGKSSSWLASADLLSHLWWVIYYQNTLRGHPADRKLRYYIKVPALGWWTSHRSGHHHSDYTPTPCVRAPWGHDGRWGFITSQWPIPSTTLISRRWFRARARTPCKMHTQQKWPIFFLLKGEV